MKINNRFELSSTLQVLVSGIYYAPRNIPQGMQSARSSIDIGVRKKVINGKGELSSSFTDIFNRFGIEQKLIGAGFTAVYQNFYETQVFRLGLNYKF